MQGRQVHDRLRATTFADYYEQKTLGNRTGRERRHIGRTYNAYEHGLEINEITTGT